METQAIKVCREGGKPHVVCASWVEGYGPKGTTHGDYFDCDGGLLRETLFLLKASGLVNVGFEAWRGDGNFRFRNVGVYILSPSMWNATQFDSIMEVLDFIEEAVQKELPYYKANPDKVRFRIAGRLKEALEAVNIPMPRYRCPDCKQFVPVIIDEGWPLIQPHNLSRCLTSDVDAEPVYT